MEEYIVMLNQTENETVYIVANKNDINFPLK